MARKQWGTTYDEGTLREFQACCDEYGMKTNTVLEALMKFFIKGNCRLVIDRDGISVELRNQNQNQ